MSIRYTCQRNVEEDDPASRPVEVTGVTWPADPDTLKVV
jgi:hypothetical protein